MSKVKEGIGLTFDDVLIEPNISGIKSRNDVSIHSNLAVNSSSKYPNGETQICLDVPIFSSCMDTVTELDMARKMAELGGLGILHRYVSINIQVGWIKQLYPVGFVVAVGSGEEDRDRVDALYAEGATFFCVDVANGQSIYAAEMVRWIKKEYPYSAVMAGNVATAEGFNFLQYAGADMIRVGIGGGSFCTTRTTTGIGVPQLTSIIECAKIAEVPLIADGGIRKPSDAAKAFAAGADAIMLGGLLAGTDESPGALLSDSETGLSYKIGRGMSSIEAQEARYAGTDKDLSTVVAEGVVAKVPYIGSTAGVINNLMGGLRSAMSYVGAKNLKEFKEMSHFIQITNAGLAESHPHILTY